MMINRHVRSVMLVGALSLASVACDRDADMSDTPYFDPAEERPTVEADSPQESEGEQKVQAESGLDARVETDALAGEHPNMVNARFAQVTFDQGDTYLTEPARQELEKLAKDIGPDKDVYLTVRIIDENNIEATEPQGTIAELANPRFGQVTEFLAKKGLNLTEAALDDTGVVASSGEDTGMVSPSPNIPEEQYQVVVIDIHEDKI